MNSQQLQYQLESDDWDGLIQNIKRGKCILLLGPDVATLSDESGAPCMSRQFAHQLAAELKSPPATLDREDLAHVAQLYVNQAKGDRGKLERAAERFYKPFRDQRNSIHDDLAALPFALCITTTPDQLLVNALRNQGKHPKIGYYDMRGGRAAQVGPSSAAQPLVYQLFGSVADSRSLVLTETDLLEFLVKIITPESGLPSDLKNQFSEDKNPDISFLFIGFGFQRWYLRILLHVLRQQSKPTRRSLALESENFFVHPEREKTSLFFDHVHSIEFRNGTWLELTAELKRRYLEDEQDSFVPAPAELPADAPTVFLCHSSQDREAVAAFAERLRAAGINTWLDRDNLRGGDNWDRQLMHVIGKVVDYVLVLQTPSITRKSEGYFFKEIEAAQERQTHQATGFLFVLPAYFQGESDTKLDEFRATKWHYYDLRNELGFKRLLEAIREDQRKRKERANGL
jgi:hypothetical protein